MSYLFVYDTNDQKTNCVISFEKITICEKFKNIDNTNFYSEEDCTVNITLRVQFRIIDTEYTDAQIYAIINRNQEKIVIDSSKLVNESGLEELTHLTIATSSIKDMQPISVAFITKLKKNDCITFHTKSNNDNIKIGASSFNEYANLPKSECPVSASLQIHSI